MNGLTVLAAGETTLQGVFNNIQGILIGIATTAITIAVIIIGFKIMFAIRNGDNVRSRDPEHGSSRIRRTTDRWSLSSLLGIAGLLQAVGKQIAGPKLETARGCMGGIARHGRSGSTPHCVRSH